MSSTLVLIALMVSLSVAVVFPELQSIQKLINLFQMSINIWLRNKEKDLSHWD